MIYNTLKYSKMIKWEIGCSLDSEDNCVEFLCLQKSMPLEECL